MRRIAIGGLTAFVLAGLLGAFGYRTGSVTATGGGYELRLSYPLVGRPGVPIQWILHVQRAGGLPEHVTIATSLGYFDLLELNAIAPEPTSTSYRDGQVRWTFDAPPTGDLTILIDAYVSPNARRGVSAVTSVLQDGVVAASVSYHTRVAP